MNSDLLIVIAYVAAAAISVSVGVAAWNRRPAPGSTGLVALSAAQAQWSATFALQWILTDHGPSLAWLAVRNVGLFASPLAILAIALSYTGREGWLTRKRLVLLAVVPVVSLAAIVTDPWHGLYLAGTPPTMKITHGGPVFTLNMIYSYGLVLWAAVLIALHIARRPPYPLQAKVLLAAVLLPVVHFVAQMAGFDLVPGVNSVPFTFTASGALCWYALTRLGLFRLMPIARDQLLEQLPLGVIVYDAERRIIDMNAAARRMTRSTATVIGKTSEEAFPHLMHTIRRLREGLTSYGAAVARSEFAPGLWVEATASTVKDRFGQDVAFLVTLRDVSEQYEAERMQRDFVANVAHELQTPLTGLSLLATTIPRAMKDDPDSVEMFLGRLSAEVERLKKLTTDLMGLSRIDSPVGSLATPPLMDLSAFASDALEELALHAQAKQQTLTTHIEDGVMVRSTDYELRQIIENLVNNAIRYTHPNGRIDVTLRGETDDSGSQWAVLEVTDNGMGIPHGELERIFERFYRVDKARSRATGGAGLGLSIVRTAARALGGDVTAASIQGAGSTFTVRIPCSDEGSAEADG